MRYRDDDPEGKDCHVRIKSIQNDLFLPPLECFDLSNIDQLKTEILIIVKERFRYFLLNFSDILKSIRENSENSNAKKKQIET